MRRAWSALLVLAGLALSVSTMATATAADWPAFRGPKGTGICEAPLQVTEWNASKNLLWKTDLPGEGSSSPIVVGDKIFVTCYSGYGLDGAAGSQDRLLRHLVCISAKDGSILWQKAVKPYLPEDRAGGMLNEHGFASHTPVSDGERVYVFFGKTGVLAFDLEGHQLWQTSVGTGSGAMNWGSASSVVLYKDLVIVNADAESEAIVALDKKDGKQVWKAEAQGYKGSWSTPVLVDVDGRQELVLNVPGEIWGLDPASGKLQWYCETGHRGSTCTSVVAHQGIIYSVLGGPGGKLTLAVRAGGKNDVSKTHVVWKKNVGTYVPSPVVLGKNLYIIDDGTFQCVDAESGAEVYRQRLSGGRNAFYASLSAAGDKVLVVSRRNGTFVVDAGRTFKQVAQNEISGDGSDFNASPAFFEGKLLLRSNKRLYCIGQSG